jgi:hypothetical protein
MKKAVKLLSGAFRRVRDEILARLREFVESG